MNFKVLCLSGLTLAIALPAYSSTNLHQHPASNAVLVAQSMSHSGGAMMSPGNAMMSRSNTMLKIGSTGGQVRAVQKFLAQKGFYSGSISGTFDEQTRAAVIKFQNSKNITPTGIVGPTTRAAMM